MIIEDNYYVIVFTNDLTYQTPDAYPCSNISCAEKFYSIARAKDEINQLDEGFKEYAKIYAVKEKTEYELCLEED